MPVHDRLWQAGRAGGVEHPQGMVERDLLEGQLGFRRSAGPIQQLRPGEHTGSCAGLGVEIDSAPWCRNPRCRIPRSVGRDSRLPIQARIRIEVGQQHDVLDRRQLREDAAHDVEAVEVLAPVPVAVDREQHLRLDLGEAVDHAARPELGRGARPDRADARRREERDQCLGDVRHVGDDAIAAAHAERAQPGRGAGDFGGQLASGELGGWFRFAQLRAVQDRDLPGISAGCASIERPLLLPEPGRSSAPRRRVSAADGVVGPIKGSPRSSARPPRTSASPASRVS